MGALLARCFQKLLNSPIRFSIFNNNLDDTKSLIVRFADSIQINEIVKKKENRLDWGAGYKNYLLKLSQCNMGILLEANETNHTWQ